MIQSEKITVGGGCFWCVEAVVRRLEGVSSVVSGYAGGSNPNPTYREVCSGRSGHAEVVQVTFDPSIIGLADLLEIFMTTHDPSTLNRQGADSGTQYRSVIYWHSDAQKETVTSLIKSLDASGIWNAPIVTEIGPLDIFYEAEKYHQEYYDSNPYQPYCMAVIAPKVTKLRTKHAHRLKEAAK